MSRYLAYIILTGLMFNADLAQAKTNHNSKLNTHAVAVTNNSRYSDIVIEAATGRVVHSTNANNLRHPASLTKMMTLYLTFQALKDGRLQLGQALPVSAKAAHQPACILGLKPGASILVKDAIMSIVTQSANDSAVVLAEALGGDEANFSHAMTQQAAALGMNQTHFYNASGLPDPNQMTTAADIAILSSALINHFPQFYNYFSLAKFRYGGNLYHNHNHLMERYAGMDGIKTGYIGSSGFNLAASAKRGNVRLIGVVFGGSSPASRDARMEQLLNEGFAAIQQTAPSLPKIHQLSEQAAKQIREQKQAETQLALYAQQWQPIPSLWIDTEYLPYLQLSALRNDYKFLNY